MRGVKVEVTTLCKVRRTMGNSNQIHEPDVEKTVRRKCKENANETVVFIVFTPCGISLF